MVLNKMAAICSDFEWSGPFKNQILKPSVLKRLEFEPLLYSIIECTRSYLLYGDGIYNGMFLSVCVENILKYEKTKFAD